MSAATMEISMAVPQKTETQLPYDPDILLLGIYLKKCKSTYNRDNCKPMFIAALFTRTKYEMIAQ
jgi:hypothetical protein